MPDLVEGRGIPEGIPEGMPDLDILEFFTLSLTMMMVDEGRSEVEEQEMKQEKSQRAVQCRGRIVPKNVGKLTVNLEITLEVAKIAQLLY